MDSDFSDNELLDEEDINDDEFNIKSSYNFLNEEED